MRGHRSVSIAAPMTGAPRAPLNERMRRGTFPPQGGGGKRQEASPARGVKARRKVFGMTMKRYSDDFSQRPCGGTARRQIGRPLPAVPRGGKLTIEKYSNVTFVTNMSYQI